MGFIYSTLNVCFYLNEFRKRLKLKQSDAEKFRKVRHLFSGEISRKTISLKVFYYKAAEEPWWLGVTKSLNVSPFQLFIFFIFIFSNTLQEEEFSVLPTQT